MRFREREDYLGYAQGFDPDITQVYTDSEFIVEVHGTHVSSPFRCRLVVKRIDKAPVRAWRDLQDIKNEIVGKDAVAIEIYPREDHVTDTGNLYHLWVLREGYEIPVILTPPG